MAVDRLSQLTEPPSRPLSPYVPPADRHSALRGLDSTSDSDHTIVVVPINTPLLSSDNHHAPSRDTQRMDALLHDANEVAAAIRDITTSTADLQSLHTRLAYEPSTTHAQFLQTQVETLRGRITTQINDTHAALKRLLTDYKGDVDARVIAAQQALLLRNLLNAGERFQRVQRSAAARVREDVRRQLRIICPTLTQPEVDAALKPHSQRLSRVFAEQLHHLADQREDTGIAKARLKACQTQKNELLAIEESVSQLVTLFEEMAQHLDRQQEIMYAIDDHVYHAATHIEEGSKDLSGAIESAKAARRKMWILVVIICSAAGFMLLLFLMQTRMYFG